MSTEERGERPPSGTPGAPPDVRSPTALRARSKLEAGYCPALPAGRLFCEFQRQFRLGLRLLAAPALADLTDRHSYHTQTEANAKATGSPRSRSRRGPAHTKEERGHPCEDTEEEQESLHFAIYSLLAGSNAFEFL